MPSENPGHISPVAALLAWLWPGLGHMYRGERKRGGLIMAGVLFLFLSGLIVGGLNCVEMRKPVNPAGQRPLNWWFTAQFFNGPIALGANFANERLVKNAPPEQRMQRMSIGQVREIGTLFIALAGLMNLVCILDAMHPAPRRMLDRRAAAPAGATTVDPGELPSKRRE